MSRSGIFTATIASGQTVSGVVQIGDQPLVGLIINTWGTTADLTLQGNTDGGNTYYPLYDSTGTQIKFASAGQGNGYALNPGDTVWPKFIKVVSSVAQGAGGTVTLVTKDI